MTAVAIVTAGHFSTNPRVVKEADALAAAGFEVEVFGVRYDPFQTALDESFGPRQWTFTAAADLRPSSAKWPRFRYRLQRKIGGLLDRIGAPNDLSLGFAAGRLLDCALERSAPLTIVHLESGLWVGRGLLRRGRTIGVDVEDWHSRGPSHPPALRRKLDSIERDVLQGAKHRTTTSTALAVALANEYAVAPPIVIPNSSTSGAGSSTAPTGDLRLFWFSQTVGPNRGLETLMDALAGIPDGWLLTLLGRCSGPMGTSLLERLPEPLRRCVAVLDFVPPGELHQETVKHDVGFALETTVSLNNQLTASNKIFQYLQAGLFVLATETPGQTEVLNRLPHQGTSFPIGDADAMRTMILDAFENKERRRRLRTEWAAAADAAFAYEHFARRLVDSVRAALA